MKTLEIISKHLGFSIEETSYFITNYLNITVPPYSDSLVEDYIFSRCKELNKTGRILAYIQKNNKKIPSPFKNSKSVKTKSTPMETNRRKH